MTKTATRRQDISPGACPISPKTGVKFHSTPKNIDSRKFQVPSRLFERERLNTLGFFSLRNLGTVYAHLEFRGCFTLAPLCTRSSEGQVALCVSHSHMIPLREEGREAWRGRVRGGTKESAEEEKKNKKKTDPAYITVMDPYVTP